MWVCVCEDHEGKPVEDGQVCPVCGDPYMEETDLHVPTPDPPGPPQVELRDRFAMAALQGLLAGQFDGPDYSNVINEQQARQISKSSYVWADAMMEARDD